MDMNNTNNTILKYDDWNPAEGDFKKVNASEDSKLIKKKLRKNTTVNILLISLWIIIAASSLYFFLLD